jgi:hypothetical protein
MNCVPCVVEKLYTFLEVILKNCMCYKITDKEIYVQLPCRSDKKSLCFIAVLDVCDMVCVDLSACGPVAVGGVYFVLWCAVVQLPTCMAG